jgi:transketolase
MKCYIPFCNEDVESVVLAMMERKGPAYLRLGFGNIPPGMKLPGYSAVRRLVAGGKITVIGAGPVLLGVFKALDKFGTRNSLGDIFAVSEMPLLDLNDEIRQSVLSTKNVLIIEEHVRRGGLGENIAALFMEEGISCRFSHLYAMGYPGGTYGSQKYHLEMNGLSPEKLFVKLKELLIGK